MTVAHDKGAAARFSSIESEETLGSWWLMADFTGGVSIFNAFDPYPA